MNLGAGSDLKAKADAATTVAEAAMAHADVLIERTVPPLVPSERADSDL